MEEQAQGNFHRVQLEAWNRFSILLCRIRFSEVLGGRYMSLVTL